MRGRAGRFERRDRRRRQSVHTVMHPDALAEVDRLVDSGTFVGGGCSVVMERRSSGLAVTEVVGNIVMTLMIADAIRASGESYTSLP